MKEIDKKDWYSEYAIDRKQSPFGYKCVSYWHSVILREVQKITGPLKGKKLLEIGVGHGQFAKVASGNDIHYTGIEMNEVLARNLRDEGLNVITGTFPPIHYQGKVDVIWLSHVLEHAHTYAHAREMLKCIYDSLDHGGTAVILVPDYVSWGNEFWNCDWSHGFPTTKRRMRQLCNDVGFKNIITKDSIANTTQPLMVWALNFLFKFFPYNLLDALCSPVFKGKTYFYSFMTVFGWRNFIFVVKK